MKTIPLTVCFCEEKQELGLFAHHSLGTTALNEKKLSVGEQQHSQRHKFTKTRRSRPWCVRGAINGIKSFCHVSLLSNITSRVTGCCGAVQSAAQSAKQLRNRWLCRRSTWCHGNTRCRPPQAGKATCCWWVVIAAAQCCVLSVSLQLLVHLLTDRNCCCASASASLSNAEARHCLALFHVYNLYTC